MLPVIALVGRPNVGKSTLFNRLTRKRDALISAFPGTTRDRQFGEVNLENRRFIIIDTGGITDEKDDMDQLTLKQTTLAIQESDSILFIIDGRTGITPADRKIANKLRKYGKTIHLIVNKIEGLDPAVCLADAYELGMGKPIGIAATHGTGITNLLEILFPESSEKENPCDLNEANLTPQNIKLAIIGRPNAGKSTLINRMLGEERVIVHDFPGTTRDSIFIPLERFGKNYTLIDTAGVRRRTKISDIPEKFSVIKTLQAIENTQIVIYVIDARLGVSDQDLKLLGFVLECGKALVIAVNKWDGMTENEKDHAKATVDRKLNFVSFARLHYISALHGSGVGNLFDSVNEAYDSATKKLSTPQLTRLLQQAVMAHSPPLVKGRKVKLRYAHPGGHNPPRIIIHGNQLNALPESYRRFLASFFQEKLALFGTPIYIVFKTSNNPFSDKG